MRALYVLACISKQGHMRAVAHLAHEAAKEPSFVGLILEVREMHPGMGLRAVYEQFQPEGIGRDAFVALGLRNGFRLKVPENPQVTTKSVKNRRYPNLLEGRRFTGVNQLWSSDIFYFPLRGRHYYGTLIMDVYSRRIVGWNMADNLRAENNLTALRRALALRGIANYAGQLVHHSDRGSQYVSDDYTGTLADHGIRTSMCSEVLENAHMERANGTIKNDYLNNWLRQGRINGEQELFKRMEMAVNNYNNRRHKTLGKTPIEFETYVNELPEQKRTVLEIFVYKQTVENPAQLRLNFEP